MAHHYRNGVALECTITYIYSAKISLYSCINPTETPVTSFALTAIR